MAVLLLFQRDQQEGFRNLQTEIKIINISKHQNPLLPSLHNKIPE